MPTLRHPLTHPVIHIHSCIHPLTHLSLSLSLIHSHTLYSLLSSPHSPARSSHTPLLRYFTHQHQHLPSAKPSTPCNNPLIHHYLDLLFTVSHAQSPLSFPFSLYSSVSPAFFPSTCALQFLPPPPRRPPARPPGPFLTAPLTPGLSS